ncbi:MAG: hypothetical protein ACOYXC_07090 [Candidatus Rifleibacteriota bacterium]
MKISIVCLMMITLFCLVACSYAADPSAEGFKTLRLTMADEEKGIAWYVPVKPQMSGPGNATAPIRLLLGSDYLIQGMLSFKADEKEVKKLEEMMTGKYGKEMVARPDLTRTLSVHVTCDGKTLFENHIFAGGKGFPIQINLAQGSDNRVKVKVSSGGQAVKSIANDRFISVAQNKTIVMDNHGVIMASESVIASGAIVQNDLSPASFTVETELEL